MQFATEQAFTDRVTELVFGMTPVDMPEREARALAGRLAKETLESVRRNIGWYERGCLNSKGQLRRLRKGEKE